MQHTLQYLADSSVSVSSVYSPNVGIIPKCCPWCNVTYVWFLFCSHLFAETSFYWSFHSVILLVPDKDHVFKLIISGQLVYYFPVKLLHCLGFIKCSFHVTVFYFWNDASCTDLQIYNCHHLSTRLDYVIVCVMPRFAECSVLIYRYEAAVRWTRCVTVWYSRCSYRSYRGHTAL